MTRYRTPSRATLRILQALADHPRASRYGYELMKTTGLSSGTIYPILMRLRDRGLLQAQWRPAAENGRPPRHAYRLTDEGLAFAAGALNTALKETRRSPRNRIREAGA